MSDFNDLGSVLDRATDEIEARSGAADALAEARRRRGRRRGAVAGLVAAVAVVAVVVTVRVATGPSDGTGLPPAESPSPTPDVTMTLPAIPSSRIQPVWDPRGAEGLPVVELGVPRVMESLTPGVVTRPVAVLDDGNRALLVSADGLSTDLDLPDGLGNARLVALSPDGTRIAAAGASGIFVRTLDGDWQRVGDQVTGEGLSVVWRTDGTPLVHREAHGGDVGSDVDLGSLGDLQRVLAVRNSMAAARAGDRDGLIALDRTSLVTRAFLPVPGQDGYYVDGAGALTPVAWLSDDTFAFTVQPLDAPKEYLLTWNVETGEVSRVSCWLSPYDAGFATDLLGRS